MAQRYDGLDDKAETKLRKKILLGHLAARGDCLYATTVARQIKHDYPGCHLTWAIGTPYLSILTNNPYVDDIWEIPMPNDLDVADIWSSFEIGAKERQLQGEFDEIFLTQIYPNNFHHFDGTIRSSIFRAYPRPITVPVTPVIKLTEEEVSNAKLFAEKHQLQSRSQVILFEFSHKSGQSFVTPAFALDVAEKLAKRLPNLAVIFSSQSAIASDHPAIIDGSSLSFRENAEITKYCDLLLGCSSGISWLCTSEWAKKLPTIQLLKKSQSVYASMKHDFDYFGLDSRHIIEMTECEADHLSDCIVSIFNESFMIAQQKYHEEIELNFDYYFSLINSHLIKHPGRHYYTSLFNTFQRYKDRFLLPCSNYFEQATRDICDKNIKLQKECDDRLKVIEQLHAEVIRLRNSDSIVDLMKRMIKVVLSRKRSDAH